jgi:hypothetical protein
MVVMTTGPTGLEGLAFPQDAPPPGEYSQRADEVLDYTVDYSGFLPTGDVIVSSTWTADEGLILSRDSFTDSSTTIWVSGGVAGFLYRVHNLIETQGGRVVDRKLLFKIKQP